MGWMCALFGLLLLTMYSVSSLSVSFVLLSIATVGGATVNGPLFALVQSLVSPGVRARAIAVLYLFANLVGMGLGPLASGMLSDAFAPQFGAASLRVALLTLSPGYALVGAVLWLTSGRVKHDLAFA
jgi:hypothetical protein